MLVGARECPITHHERACLVLQGPKVLLALEPFPSLPNAVSTDVSQQRSDNKDHPFLGGGESACTSFDAVRLL